MLSISQPFELLLFGGGGDLSLRKLLPALFDLFVDRQLPGRWRVLSISRSPLSQIDYHTQVRDSLLAKDERKALVEAHFPAFAAHVEYLALDAESQDDMQSLLARVESDVVRIFYFATRSDLYISLATNLAQAGLILAESRVVLEKPIGGDKHSAALIEEAMSECFGEDRIYRIDHYLGKETVQNLLVLRFANTIFESLWNQKYIDHIQITIAESMGVVGRADYYDQFGALRDMGQNHLLQLLCMTAMEPPYRLNADAVRDEKVKVLRALRPITGADIPLRVVRGQYQGGVIAGRSVPGYLDEAGVAEHSETETFVAIKAEIDNWRWAGVPFYLRTGKRLAHRACEITVHFREVPHSIFELQHKSTMSNRLVFRLQPDEGVRLSLCEKQLGAGMHVRSSQLSLNPDRARRSRVPDAYERLLVDVVGGNPTLFVRSDEFMVAWDWLDPTLRYWQNGHRPEPYAAGSWGPAASTLMLARDGRLWDDMGD